MSKNIITAETHNVGHKGSEHHGAVYTQCFSDRSAKRGLFFQDSVPPFLFRFVVVVVVVVNGSDSVQTECTTNALEGKKEAAPH